MMGGFGEGSGGVKLKEIIVRRGGKGKEEI